MKAGLGTPPLSPMWVQAISCPLPTRGLRWQEGAVRVGAPEGPEGARGRAVAAKSGMVLPHPPPLVSRGPPTADGKAFGTL